MVIKWEQEEEVLLVNLYYHLYCLSREEREVKIKNLSLLLRNRAIFLGINIDDTFRNIIGIKMKLQNIAYITTTGKRSFIIFKNR